MELKCVRDKMSAGTKMKLNSVSSATNNLVKKQVLDVLERKTSYLLWAKLYGLLRIGIVLDARQVCWEAEDKGTL